MNSKFLNHRDPQHHSLNKLRDSGIVESLEKKGPKMCIDNIFFYKQNIFIEMFISRDFACLNVAISQSLVEIFW